MEYACGRSLTGAENYVVELKSIYVLGTLVYVSLLRSNLTYTTLPTGDNDRWLMVSTLLNVFSIYITLRLTYDWHAFPVVIYQSDTNYVIVHLTFNAVGQEMADAIVAQPWLMCN